MIILSAPWVSSRAEADNVPDEWISPGRHAARRSSAMAPMPPTRRMCLPDWRQDAGYLTQPASRHRLWRPDALRRANYGVDLVALR